MRIAIVEDDSLLKGNLSLLLQGEPGITVTGSYSSAEDALKGLEEQVPDLMLVDIDLPGMSGIELIREVKSSHPGMEIMTFTIFEDRETVFSAIRAGASGYLIKGSTPRELVESLRILYEGGAPMSPRIARKVIRELRGEPGEGEEEALTLREKEILLRIKRGLPYKAIAEELSISPHTVHTHIKKIYEKLHAKTRGEALHRAQRQGLI